MSFLQKHTAFYISNKDNKQKLIESIFSGKILCDYSSLKGALYSDITLNEYIKEEIIHGRFHIVTDTKNSLLKSSEGERKKALLNHIISQNPEYIIIDNVFGNLDIAAQVYIKQKLADLAKDLPIIQITNRKADILPFINATYQLVDSKPVKFEHSNASNKNVTGIFLEGLPKTDRTDLNQLNPLVKFNKVTIAYRERTIIKDICWEINRGDFWQLIGPNGSGKSTMLSMIFGDNPKAYGQDINLFGTKKGSGESVWEIKEKIGYFSSEMLRGFKRTDSIGNMIVSGFFDSIGLYKIPTHQQIKAAHQWLHVLNMFDIRKQSFLSLSNGYQRLVLIARAMVKQPPLLILDEPTNGLDDFDAKLFVELINKISLETDTAILYVSHRKEEGLSPDFIYELAPSIKGSSGKQVKV